MEYKGYLIKGDQTFGMKVIQPIGRGTVPSALRGQWTNDGFAQKAIDAFVLEKDVKNGEAVISV